MGLRPHTYQRKFYEARDRIKELERHIVVLKRFIIKSTYWEYSSDEIVEQFTEKQIERWKRAKK